MKLTFETFTVKHIKDSYYTLSFELGEEEAVVSFTNEDTLYRFIGNILKGSGSPNTEDW